LEKKDLKSKIFDDIQLSGYPVEIEVLRILKNFNWTVFPQYDFIDPTSNKDERDYGVN